MEGNSELPRGPVTRKDLFLKRARTTVSGINARVFESRGVGERSLVTAESILSDPKLKQLYYRNGQMIRLSYSGAGSLSLGLDSKDGENGAVKFYHDDRYWSSIAEYDKWARENGKSPLSDQIGSSVNSREAARLLQIAIIDPEEYEKLINLSKIAGSGKERQAVGEEIRDWKRRRELLGKWKITLAEAKMTKRERKQRGGKLGTGDAWTKQSPSLSYSYSSRYRSPAKDRGETGVIKKVAKAAVLPLTAAAAVAGIGGVIVATQPHDSGNQGALEGTPPTPIVEKADKTTAERFLKPDRSLADTLTTKPAIGIEAATAAAAIGAGALKLLRKREKREYENALAEHRKSKS